MTFIRKNQLWLFFIIALAFAFGMAAVSHSIHNEGISILIPLSPSIIASHAGGPTTLCIFIGLVLLFTVIVILRFGPQTLVRKND